MRYLIVGLGNIGSEYENTRHNTGFMIVDHLASREKAEPWQDRRYGFVSRLKVKGQELVLLKPSTYMNLSGNAVRYWMQQENVPLERVLIVVDDLALPVGQIRMKVKGSDAGHNGLGHIAQILGTQNYNRLRFGIGNDFPKGGQINYVLGKFPQEEKEILDRQMDLAADAIKSFCLAGMAITMNQYNKK